MRLLSLGIERFGALSNVALDLGSPQGRAASSDPLPALALGEPTTTKTSAARRAKDRHAPKRSATKTPEPTSGTLFPAHGAGVTVIYGPNEAGKTTLLRAIRFLLLGEDKTSAGKRAPALAGGEAPSLRAVIELGSGSRVEIQRRRGKPTWVGRMLDGGAEVDEEWFAGAIGHPDASLFRNVFAFSLDELARGREVLERGLLDGLLFGSGLGGSIQPSSILADLEEAQAKLFKERGQQQPILLKLARIEGLKTDLARATTSAADLEKLDLDIEDAARRAAEVKGELKLVHEERERLVALESALEPFAAWRAAKRELERLEPLPDLPPSARLDFERAHAAMSGVREAIAQRDAELPEREAQLASAVFDPRWLQVASDIESLDRAVLSVVDAERERPERERERRALLARVERRLAELAPGMELSALRALAISREARARLAEATESQRKLERESQEVEASLAMLRAEREELLQEKAELPAAEAEAAVERIARWLDGVPEHVVLRDRLESVETELGRAIRSEALLRAKLDPEPQGDDPALVPMPRAEEIDSFDRYLSEHEETLRALVAELRRTEHELASLRGDIAEIRADGDVPTEGELAAARERRNLGWSLVVRSLSGRVDPSREVAFDEHRPLPDAFERAMQDADDLVDRMRFRADAVQRRAQKEAAALHREQEMERLNEAHVVAAEARSLAITEWTALWEAAGVIPKEPRAMRAWLGDRARWLDALEKVRDVRLTRSTLLSRLAAFVDAGRALLGVEGDLGPLRAAAEGRVQRDKARREAAAQLEQALERVSAAILKTEARLEILAKERGAADERVWEAWAALGQSVRPNVLDELLMLRDSLVEGEAAIDARLATLGDVGERFKTRLDAVMSRLGMADAARASSVEADVAHLKHELTRAQDAARRAADAKERIERLTREREIQVRQWAEAEAVLVALRARAGVADDVALEAATSRAELGRTLLQEVEAAERALARIRGPFTFDALLEAAAEATSETIGTELRALAARLDAETKRHEALLEEQATLRSRRGALDGGGGAADLMADIAAERAALRADVEEFAVVALAKVVLERGIESFERAHQPALVEEASRLFAEMTTGRYRHVRTTAKKELLVEHENGGLRAPEELSTGTNEQLFFALRLAYVTLYSARTEPLPVILDDVLVNFDRARSAATLGALGTFARNAQVLFFTCHEHLLELARETLPGARLLRL